jgi:regulator of CtrA degradation
MFIEERQSRVTPKVIDALYIEAMLLADEARSYFDDRGREERGGLDPLLRVEFTCEALKVTTRLMHVIAWLLNQRAVEAGEITAAQARQPERSLGDAAGTDSALLRRLPREAAGIIAESEELYDRVRRVADGGDSGGGQASPARTLMNRLERAF